MAILLAEDETAIISRRFRDRFKATQALPDVEAITDDDILAEITAHHQECIPVLQDSP
jgi:hypothetical protein